MEKAKIRFGQRWIGAGEPVYIVAEAGSNHNGNLDQALRLVDIAADAGADAVKFQLFRAAKLYPRSAGASDYLRTTKSIYDIIREMELPEEWVPRLAMHCHDRGIDFLCSPFDEWSADVLFDHVLAYKIASYEMTHHPLVQYIARKGKPVMISTGAASLAEVRDTVDAFQSTGNRDLILLQCTAKYPAPVTALNLRTIPRMRDEFAVPVGLSDHSREPLPGPLAAVGLGVAVIEKHFTLSNRLPGPDHAYALEPHELADMIRKVREVERALGSGVKEPLPEEFELRAFARRSIFSIRAIRPGEQLTSENVAVLRCGKLKAGLEPRFYSEVLGRRAIRHIPAESAIFDGDYE